MPREVGAYEARGTLRIHSIALNFLSPKFTESYAVPTECTVYCYTLSHRLPLTPAGCRIENGLYLGEEHRTLDSSTV